MFLEEVIETPHVGTSLETLFAVQVIVTQLNRYTILRHPYVQDKFSLVFNNQTVIELADNILDVFHRIGGMAGGFRFYNHAEYSSNNYVDIPTYQDQLCLMIDSTHYQLMRWYGTSITATTPRRKIKKPIDGTVLLSVKSGAVYTPLLAGFTINYTTGIITLTAPLGVGETLYAGYNFDFPVMFETNLNDINWSHQTLLSTTIDLVEVLNPENL